MPLNPADLRFLMATPADEEEDANPIEQLVDLLVYAPVGLLYEYEDVLPKLVKRGKSQVQLARVLGQMAARGQGQNVDASDVVGTASTLIARAVTEFGAMVGLAPASPSTQSSPSSQSEPPADVGVDDEPAPPPAMPIANYDDLTAREVIPLLGSLSATQRAVVRSHELEGRSRKTVLAKLDRLDS